jgi:adenylosuccinate synthase
MISGGADGCCLHPQGGANAGHTIYDEAGTKYALHQVRSAPVPHHTSVPRNDRVWQSNALSCEPRLAFE